MVPDEYEAKVKAFEVRARVLRAAFEQAIGHTAALLNEAAGLPYGQPRLELVARAREQLRLARHAIDDRIALSRALLGSSAPLLEEPLLEAAFAQLTTMLEELSPSREG